VTSPAWLLWPPVARLATDCTLGPVRWEPRSPDACSTRRRAEAVINRDSGPGQDPAVGRTRRCHGPGDQHVRRELEAVVLVRRDTAPARGEGG
jgi:hypothetical protein